MKARGKWIAPPGVLLCLLGYAAYASLQLPSSQEAPRAGQKAPDFTLPDTSGQPVKLSELLATPSAEKAAPQKGRWVLLVFYRGYW